MSGIVAAYAAFGAKLKNHQWSWSAIAPNGDVILTLWQDQFNFKTEPPSYSTPSHDVMSWKDRPGNKERIENIKHALARNGGRIRVVIARAVDPAVDPRTILEAFPRTKMVFRIREFNEETGEFRAVLEQTSAPEKTTEVFGQ
jgi:hypothetical protein